jgi:hypothetical protein
MPQPDKTQSDREMTELNTELMNLNDISLEELEMRLELAMGQVMRPMAVCSCDCPSLTSCFMYCTS